MKQMLLRMFKKFNPDIREATKMAESEIEARRLNVRSLLKYSFTDIDNRLQITRDNGGIATRRSGYVSSRHLRRAKRYALEEEEKLLK